MRHSATSQLLIVLTLLCRTALGQRRSIVLHAKDNTCSLSIWFHRQHHALVVFLAEPAGFEKGNSCTTVLTGDSTRPEVGDRGLTVYSRVETSKISLGLLQYPPAPGANMPSKIGFDGGYMSLDAGQLWLRCLVCLQTKGRELYLQSCSLQAFGLEIGFHKVA